MSKIDPGTSDKQVVVLRNAEVIDREAAAWLTRLDRGDLSDAEQKSLKAWLAQDPSHLEALNDMACMWRDMDFLLNELPNEQSEPARISELFTIKPRVMAVAASLFFAVCMTLWANNFFSVERMVFTTDIGRQLTQDFSDGSSAQLNTNTVIEIEFTRNTRIVRLMRGEALFDVAHDPSRPFVVYAGDQAVKAIGTAFVVKIESEQIQVTVTEGQVQLSKRQDATHTNDLKTSEESILISRGEWVNLDGKTSDPKPAVLEESEIDKKLSWSSGKLVFDNERLEDVIKEIARYVPNRIIIEDENLRNVRVSGRFSLGNTEALLEAIEVSLDLNATQIQDKKIRLHRESE